MPSRRPSYCEACGSRNRLGRRNTLHVQQVNENWTNNLDENLQTFVHLLSSVLARHTQTSWYEAFSEDVREVKRIEVSQDQKGEAPDSELHPTQYAAKLMEEIRLPHTQANLRVVAAAVTAEAKAGRTMSEAYLWLLDKAKAAQDVGTPIDRFWFEDRKWMRGQVPLKGPCVKHPNSNVTSTGGCWDCYQEANQRGVTVIR
jgi:hypothetical protein